MVVQAEPLPEFEDFLVSQQDVAARFEVIAFSNTALSDRFAKLHAVLGLNERHVVHDKNAGLANLRQFLDRALRCFYAVIASVERPRAAKNAVPRTAAAELMEAAGFELADEILSAMFERGRAQATDRRATARTPVAGRDDRVVTQPGTPFRFGGLE